MLNIELIKFEAQDVITVSCTCPYNTKHEGVAGSNWCASEDHPGCEADEHPNCKPLPGDHP